MIGEQFWQAFLSIVKLIIQIDDGDNDGKAEEALIRFLEEPNDEEVAKALRALLFGPVGEGESADGRKEEHRM